MMGNYLLLLNNPDILTELQKEENRYTKPEIIHNPGKIKAEGMFSFYKKYFFWLEVIVVSWSGLNKVLTWIWWRICWGNNL